MTDTNHENPFSSLIDLAQPRLGSQVVFATDDFFAAKERMIEPQPAVFIADKYDENGKWMDGWESRRKRESGYDYSVIRLGVPGVIKGFDIDTSHFTGNYAPSASIDACISDQFIPDDSAEWVELLPSMPLSGDSHHFCSVNSSEQFTHLRLNIYPDGGVARLRVYGDISPDWEQFSEADEIDLLALENGGRALVCNDQHFGTMHNLNAPGRGVNMGDGWETARRREPGNDWVIMALGHCGIVNMIEIDTAHFKGNYPDRVSIQAARVKGGSPDVIAAQSLYWEVLLPEVKVEMDKQHYFDAEVNEVGPITHIKMNIIPDGGVSRLRLHGNLVRD